MLYITYAHGTQNTWHVGEPTNHLIFSAEKVIQVQASDDELATIRYHFPNLPITMGRVIKWFGDNAKFIVANLPT